MNPTLEPWVRGDVALLMLGFFVSAIIAYLATLTRRRESGGQMMPEPETTGLLLIAYVSLTYLVVFLAALTPWPMIIAAAFSCGVLALGHFAAKRFVKWSERQTKAAVQAASETANSALAAAQATHDAAVQALQARLARQDLEATLLRETLGVTSVFPDQHAASLFDALAEDFSRANAVRGWASNPASLLAPTNGAIGQSLARAASQGKTIRLFSNLSAADGGLVDATVTSTSLPELWLLEVAGAIYSGMPDQRVPEKSTAIARSRAIGGAQGQPGLFDVFSRMLDRAERDSTSDMAATRVLVGKGPELYRSRILRLESSASKVDRIAKRVFVVFKDPETVQAIATQRYGSGHAYMRGYIEEHEARRKAVFARLESGLRLREIYSKSELLVYATKGQHGASATLTQESLRRMFNNWKQALINYPNYFVALSDEHLPLHYEIVDGSSVVIHEAIGFHENDRVNSIFIDGPVSASRFQEEFDTLWDRVPRIERDNDYVVKWIEAELEPLVS